ncbi:MAG: nicotinamide-nucleotide amidohydrolase family protein [Planctomycetaceae bacterium]|nr:nicotinamide-nucleotide amidohydrolase family protein [Planctomycetaceae bacterium]
MNDSLAVLQATRQLLNELIRLRKRIVFAESCTAGLLAATLGQIAGVSEVLCGSAVTYRNLTKANWLGIDPALLDNPHIGPVSEIVARQMAEGVLQRTEEAALAVSVTGHLGPNAPEEQDGIAYVGICQRGESLDKARVIRFELPKHYPGMSETGELRACRQIDLVARIFTAVAQELRQSPDLPARPSLN